MVYIITKSLSGDLGGNIASGGIEDEIINSGIITPFYGITVTGDEVLFVFDSVLSAPELIIFNALLAAYIYVPDPIYDGVDLQQGNSTVMTSTTSPIFVDMDSASVTASNPEIANYKMSFTCTAQSSVADKVATIIINANGVDLSATERRIHIPEADKDVLLATGCLASNVPNGGIMKIKYKTDLGNTLKIYERVFDAVGRY